MNMGESEIKWEEARGEGRRERERERENLTTQS